MDYYRRLFRKHWKPMVAAAGMGTVAGSGFSALIIGLINRQLRTDTPPEPWVPALYVLFIVAYYVLSTYAEYLLLSLSQSELCDLRLRFGRRVLSLPLKKIEEIGGADLMASLTNDVERIAASLRQLPILFLAGSMILGAGAYAAWLSWPLFLATVALMTVGIFLYRLPLRRLGLLQRYWVRLRDGWDHLFRHFHALTHGTKELLIHRDRREVFFDRCLRDTCVQLRDDAIRGKTIQNLFFRVGDTLWLVVLGIVLFVLPAWTSIEHQVLTGYLMVGLFVVNPVGALLNSGPNFGEAVIALQRLQALGVPLDGAPADAPVGDAPFGAPPDSPALLRLEGVTYRYRREADDEEWVLGPLDLELREGESTFLTGGNGSGKTTLLKLLCGLYAPEAGRIFWRGEEVTDANRETYRQFFSVVFSDFYVFDALFGLEALALDGRAGDYLKRLHLDRKVTVEDGRLSTVALSQGQRKRLALLTAYLEDRPVYMFDEWAADQDPIFKKVFYDELLPELEAEGKTLLVITHDDAWWDRADRVVKLREGRIVGDERAVPA
jgi:putative pyoverdin transport system ATP-binding/permease protein